MELSYKKDVQAKADSRYAYIWLSRVLGPGNAKSFEIMESFCGAENICSMTAAELKTTGVFSPAELNRAGNIKRESILEVISYCDNHNIRIITPLSDEYPPGFAFIEAPPLVIYARGERLLADEPYFAIVGSRKCSDFGLKAAYSLSARLTKGGFTVVSGGAKGIDGMAHRGALMAGGKTVAVLGAGIDSDYLVANKELRESISKAGTLISELEPKAPAGKHTFPVRNRLISALSLGVAVIESGSKSGALSTASHAMEQGKEVFTTPGSIADPHYEGNNELLRDGATPIIKAEDILFTYISRFEGKLRADTRLSAEVKEGFNKALAQHLESEKRSRGVGRTSKSPRIAKVAKSSKNKKTEKAVMDRSGEASKNTDKIDESFNQASAVEKRAETGISFKGSINAGKVLAAFIDEIELSDTLSARSKVTGSDFLVAVTELEISGYITAVPVGRYKRK